LLHGERGIFQNTLTSSQWRTVRGLAGDISGETLYGMPDPRQIRMKSEDRSDELRLNRLGLKLRRIGEGDMNRAILEQFEIFCGAEVEPDDWLWCRKCHRCYKASEFRKLRDRERIFLLCYHNDCSGDLPIDSRLLKRR
jgi:hypothetical protein